MRTLKDLLTSPGDDKALSNALIDRLNKHITEHDDHIFHLKGPCLVTIKTRQGQYKKREVGSESRFYFCGLYLGKRGKVICVFKPTGPVDFAFIEMDEGDARDRLTAFSEFLDALLNTDFDTQVADIRRRAMLSGQEMIQQKARHNPVFGSW